jgi:hypothetical protein
MAKVEAKSPDQVSKPVEQTAWGMFREGFESESGHFSDDYLTSLIRNSAFNPKGYKEVFEKTSIGPAEKAAYVTGRLAHDVITDGSRMPYWALNHPLAITGVAGQAAAQYAGLSPDYAKERVELEGRGEAATRSAIDAEFAKRNGFYHGGEGHGVPLALARYAIPAMATGALTQLSDNTNYLNILGGGRTPGFQAVLPVQGDPTQSENALLELGARYMFGRTGRVLPWEQFHAERPDVSFDDYNRYAAYQFDKGFLNLGLIKGTTRNLDGEMEGAMMGFRVPVSAATGAVGAIAGGVFGAQQADAVINEELRNRFQGLHGTGNRRLAGAAIGAAIGAIGGKITGRLGNDLVQPLLNPRSVAASQAWQDMTEEQRIAIAEGKGSNKHDQGTQLALVQA